jgi:hypothetical protein
MSDAQHFALVIPGILGSCLRYQVTGQDLWTEDFSSNYLRLARDYPLFQYTPGRRADPTAILKTAHFLGLPVKGIFGRVLDCLHGHPRFSHRDGVLEFPYDWRGDLLETAEMLGTSLRQRFGADPEKWTCRITVVTHSMGGLVARIALVSGALPPATVAQMVHIAPPFAGSASAFRSVYRDVRFPLTRPLLDLIWRKNRNLAQLQFRRVMATFPAAYQCMPPETDPYLYIGSAKTVNPFGPGQSVVSPAMKAAAAKASEAIRKSVAVITESRVPVDTIRSDLRSGKTDLEYRVFDEGDRYDVMDPLPYRDTPGDGTVSMDSCAYHGDDAATLHDLLGLEHAFMCDQKAVVRELRTILV